MIMSDPAFVLPERLDNTEAETLRAQLLARRHAPLALDGRAVRSLGALSAQVLVSAVLQWRADGQSLGLDGSPALIADLTNLGFAVPEIQEGPSK
jgi:anti-anti-sigma regulatory factor